MKSVFLGQHIVNKEEIIKGFCTPHKYKVYRYEKFHECELDRELKEGNYINIDGEIKIEKVIYELDGSTSYKTTKKLSEI